MRLDPVVQGLLNHSQAAGYRCHRLARLHKSNRLLLELKRVTTTRCLRHLRVPFAIKAACYGIRFAGARSQISAPDALKGRGFSRAGVPSTKNAIIMSI